MQYSLATFQRFVKNPLVSHDFWCIGTQLYIGYISNYQELKERLEVGKQCIRVQIKG